MVIWYRNCRTKSVLTYYCVPIPTKLLFRSAVASHNNKSHCFSLKKAHSGAFFCGSGAFAFIAYCLTHLFEFFQNSYNGASYLPSVGFGQVNNQIKDVFEKEKVR